MKLQGDEQVGAQIVRRSLEAPIRQIAENAGQDGAVVVQNVRQGKGDNFGYNALTDTYEDLAKVPLEYMMVDASKLGRVVRAGLRTIPGVRIFPKESLSIRGR